jgi:phosphatidylserine decarboxylase
MIHKEGRMPILLLLLVFGGIYLFLENIWPVNRLVTTVFLLIFIFLIGFFLQFFRNPKRYSNTAENELIAPADGKVVIIEKVLETEYFEDERMQVSIFMSPINVHVNRFPLNGIVRYSKYHKGKFLVAWNPKSSLLNERTTVVVEPKEHEAILYRQIAGALARRIINYAKEGMIAKKGSDSGFIRFGSRVDLLLPLESEILVNIGDIMKGGETIVARIPKK